MDLHPSLLLSVAQELKCKKSQYTKGSKENLWPYRQLTPISKGKHSHAPPLQSLQQVTKEMREWKRSEISQ